MPAYRSARTALKLLAIVACAALALGGEFAAADGQDTGGVYDLDLPAQNLHAALQQVALASGHRLLYRSELVTGKTSKALKGRFTAREAVEALLAGTGLVFEITPASVVLIREGDGKSGSTTRAEPSASRVRARTEGSLQAGEAQTRPSAGEPAPRDDRGSRTMEDERSDLGEILVTGSRLKRIDTEGPSPVITITQADIERSGRTTVREVLSTLPQAAVARDESANSFLGASNIQLRGLSTGSTLTLINGHRASGYSESFFDLNSLPLEAIERIEILTDTASAVYGADAIAGAVNFILKNGYEGMEASLRYGTSDAGGATERSGALTLGGAGEEFSGLAVLSVFDRDPLFGRERELSRSSDFSRFGSIDFRSTFSYPANVYSLDGSNLPGLNNPFAGAPGGDGVGLTPGDFAATDGVLNLYDAAPFTSIVAESTRMSAFLAGSAQLTPALRLSGEALHSRNEQVIEVAPDVLFGGAFGFFTVPATNPFNPFGVPVGVDYRFSDIGPRSFDGTMKYSRARLGVDGPLGERLRWEASLLYDRNEQTVLNRDHVNAFVFDNIATIQQQLDSTDPAVALNVFSSTGNNNGTTLAALLDEDVSLSRTEGLLAETVLRGEILQLPAGAVQLAVGANARRDEGAFDDGGFSPPLEARRESWALFAETVVPLVSPAWSAPAAYSASVTLAVRHDHFDTFGSETNPQLGFVWRPVRSLLVRASYGEAFKAPTLNDLYAQVSETLTQIPDPLRNGEFTGVALRTGGNPDVRPERAEAVNLGFVWEPGFAPGLAFGATAFRIEHLDFITRFFDFNLILTNPDLFGDRIVRDPPTPADQQAGLPGVLRSLDATTLNFGSAAVQGIDFDIRYALPETSAGRLSWLTAGSYVDEYDVQITPDVAATNEVGRANRAGYPVRFKASSQLVWEGMRGLSASVTARYLVSYADYADLIPIDRELPAQTLWDVQAGYDGRILGLGEVVLSAGAINLTDEQGSYSNSLVGYDYQQADLRGRFFHVSLRKRF